MSKRVPQFKTDEEAEKFLEQDLSDYLDPKYMVPLPFEYRPKDAQVNLRLAKELLQATHQDDRRVHVVFPELADHIQRLRQSRPAFQSALRRKLNGRTVGHGIAERNAQFDQIGAGGGQAVENLLRGLPVRIASASHVVAAMPAGLTSCAPRTGVSRWKAIAATRSGSGA